MNFYKKFGIQDNTQFEIKKIKENAKWLHIGQEHI